MRDLPHPRTIKTSAPSLAGVIERPRLIGALAQLPAAAKWLQAPSGSGKSTLAASWARNQAKPFAWYRLDERDNDPAFFFAEFADTVSAQLQLSDALPKFSAEDHDRQQAFARRFFEALCIQIDKAALFVIDDMQRLTADSMLASIAELVGLTGKRIELLFVSQETTPAAFFDAIATRRLTLLNDVDLRFQANECQAMASLMRVDASRCESISTLTGGHAGAMVLACELLRGTDPTSAAGVETVDRIHEHLLTNLVGSMPLARQQLLVQTAFVSQITRPVAEALAGPQVVQQLDALVDCGLLRRVGAGAFETFEAHGLVQQGMQTLTRARLGESAARVLAERTADVLLDNRQAEAAFAVLVDIGSTARATNVMQQLAEHYSACGQVDLLMSSIAKLPATEIRGNAWLCFWTGQALLRINEQQARAWFTDAYSAFETARDTVGMRLAAASVVTAFTLEWGDLRDLDQWIDRHRNAGGDTAVDPNNRFEATLLMGVACAAIIYGSYTPQIDADAVIARLEKLLGSETPWLSGDQRVQAARILVEQGHVFLKYELAQTAIVATRRLIVQQIGSALHRARWWIAAAFAYFESGDTERSLDALNEARSIAEASQTSRLAFEIGLAFAGHYLKADDLTSAGHELRKLEAIAADEPLGQRAEHSRLMTRLLMRQEYFAEGLRWAQEAKRLAIAAGLSGANLRAFEIELVYALAANDQMSEAIEVLGQQDFEPREVRLAIEYVLRFLIGGKADLQLLHTGLHNAAKIGFIHLLDRARAPLAQICEAALSNDIETEFVRRLIATKHLPPPPLAGPHWPWQVKVRTLGGFRLDIEGQRYAPSHKAQEKPLELLKLLVTCQALGRDSAEKSWICERLWPEAEPDNARKSLDMTAGRLRRLLGGDDTILLHEGRLKLSASHVWTDIEPLRRALSYARLQRDEHIARKPADEAGVSIAVVLEHYGGPFLAEEEGPAWVLAGREAIAAAVRNSLIAADTLLKGSADDALVPALERALAADPTSEDLARALMRAHLRRGHNGEAIRVYRRLREMLSLLLSVAPSADTEYVRDQAYAAAP